MEGVGGVGKGLGLVAAGFGFVKMGVEDDVGASAGGPADCLRVAPAFVADGDAELQVAALEEMALGAGGVGFVLGGVELDLVLIGVWFGVDD